MQITQINWYLYVILIRGALHVYWHVASVWGTHILITTTTLIIIIMMCALRFNKLAPDDNDNKLYIDIVAKNTKPANSASFKLWNNEKLCFQKENQYKVQTTVLKLQKYLNQTIICWLFILVPCLPWMQCMSLLIVSSEWRTSWCILVFWCFLMEHFLSVIISYQLIELRKWHRERNKNLKWHKALIKYIFIDSSSAVHIN